ncbi:MAG: GTP-binding protein, partial [Planctomycetota bacterium]
MVQINFPAREVNCKIVYYGPGRSGKTTNLEVVHAKAPPDSKGELVSIATETDRTLYFDFLPLNLGQIAGMNTKFQLYTVPGQVFYNATRKLVLQGADGIVFVADSNPEMRDENIESLENLAENLEENGLNINDMPLVFQWNKRDLPN